MLQCTTATDVFRMCRAGVIALLGRAMPWLSLQVCDHSPSAAARQLPATPASTALLTDRIWMQCSDNQSWRTCSADVSRLQLRVSYLQTIAEYQAAVRSGAVNYRSPDDAGAFL